ncbi:HAD family hydrolase [Zobellella sp. DQSA1]|uniref:HAD family hydrolase n=1 Tax=Zobellella sp. DQSA1 TaxID=3342386 RepID=UPI0035BF0826
MAKVYLFDWGDTLMVDFPDYQGKMCDWPRVQAVAGAREVLEALSRTHRIYIATGAADSSASEIEMAFERVGLSGHISGYFCMSNLGVPKDGPAFYERILARLGVAADQVTMVGDSLEKDILPALAAGLGAVWFSRHAAPRGPGAGVVQIRALSELCQ